MIYSNLWSGKLIQLNVYNRPCTADNSYIIMHLIRLLMILLFTSTFGFLHLILQALTTCQLIPYHVIMPNYFYHLCLNPPTIPPPLTKLLQYNLTCTQKSTTGKNMQLCRAAKLYKFLSVIHLLKTSYKVRLESFCCDRHLKVNVTNT